MKVVVAIDSLKGSLTSLEAGYAIREGIHKTDPHAQVMVRPLADGGEGTVEALILGMEGRPEKVMVTGPVGSPSLKRTQATKVPVPQVVWDSPSLPSQMLNWNRA